MNEVYVLDACALIAVLSGEKGAEIVMDIYNKALSGEASLIMNKIKLLEVYYGDYRVHGKEAADNMAEKIKMTPIKIVSEIDDGVFEKAGRLKANYKISLADSIVLAQTEVTGGIILTADHHEFDIIESKENIRFKWIRE